MKKLVARMLRRLGYLDFDYLVERVPSIPDQSIVPDDRLALVQSGEFKKWACLRCPGGCGEMINLPLNPNSRPRWAISEDFWARPTIRPSVHQKNQCGCHFWINKGRIHWCEGE